MKCTNCGAEAVKTESFGVFDIPYDGEGNKRADVTRFMGCIRFSLCRDCIAKGVKASSNWNVVSAIVLGFMGVAALLFFGLSILRDGWSWDLDQIAQMAFSAGLIGVAFFFLVPKAIVGNKKKKRTFNEKFDSTPLSLLVSDENYSAYDFEKFSYKLLFDAASGSDDPCGKLTEKSDKIFRYYYPIDSVIEQIKSNLETSANPEVQAAMLQICEQTKAKTNQ